MADVEKALDRKEHPTTDSVDEKFGDPEASHSSSSLEVTDARKGVDVAVTLLAGRTDDAPVTREESIRLRRKLDWRLLPLLFLLYAMQFIDKTSLGASAILGILADNNLTGQDLNTLSSAFYIGYIIFVYPHNIAMQYLPVGKWLTFNIFLWSIFLGLHCVCSNFGGLFALRFLLGASEGSITAGLMLVVSMFYTNTEIGERIGWTFMCNGLGIIISGFIAFGAFHVNPTGRPGQWQVLFIIVALMTVATSALFLFLFPDNPTSARFLTQEEKVRVVKRIKSNQSGIETKVWKKYQFIEALMDPKTWLFFFFCAISNLQSGIAVQYSLIIKALGFSTLTTTLLNIPSGASQIIGTTIACYILRKFPNSRSTIAIGGFIIAVIGSALMVSLPFDNQIGLLISYYIIPFGSSPGFVMVLGWVPSTSAGHTKKLTINGIFLVGYALGQMLSTQFWRDEYKPRNQIPWAINMTTYAVDIILILAIRYVLSRENKRRDAAKEAAGKEYEEFGYVDVVEDGVTVRKKVEKSLLDLTDWENQAFRYVL